ncbi:MAG: Crp/Fnr family transcriptional regulator, partial [Comamonadaceae bacterium]
MLSDLTLHQRRRPATAAELAGVPWLAELLPDERAHAVEHIRVGEAMPG